MYDFGGYVLGYCGRKCESRIRTGNWSRILLHYGIGAYLLCATRRDLPKKNGVCLGGDELKNLTHVTVSSFAALRTYLVSEISPVRIHSLGNFDVGIFILLALTLLDIH